MPEHMDRWSRNQRLYDTLKGMGLFVSPIPEPDDPTKIREMVVSADLPFGPIQQPAQQTAEAGVPGAMQRAQVGDVIDPTEADRDNVVLFPSVR